MRTRRSWRNQERLFKALTPPVDKSTVPELPEVERCWDCVCYPKGGRARGMCSFKVEFVEGITANKACFVKRVVRRKIRNKRS
jgi:hypothetical protein